MEFATVVTRDHLKKRTAFHEAGHAIVLWELYAILSPTLVADVIISGDIPDVDRLLTEEDLEWDWQGFAALGDCEYPAANDQAKNYMAVFLGGKAAVARAIDKNELSQEFEEPSPGWIGYAPPSGRKGSGSSDHDVVRKIAELSWEMYKRTDQNTPILLEDLIREAEELSRKIILRRWIAVRKVADRLMNGRHLFRIDLRKLIAK